MPIVSAPQESGCYPLDVAVQAQGMLQRAPYAALRRVGCEHQQGVLRLRGRVASYYLKQLAQELVGRLEGIELIENRIEVIRNFTNTESPQN